MARKILLERLIQRALALVRVYTCSTSCGALEDGQSRVDSSGKHRVSRRGCCQRQHVCKMLAEPVRSGYNSSAVSRILPDSDVRSDGASSSRCPDILSAALQSLCMVQS
jgi:hypothetical protein